MVTRNGAGEIEFRFFRKNARRVFVVGDFDDWNRTAHPMTPTKDGEWVCRMRLPDGVYQFKYLADGQWYMDHAAFGIEPIPFGCNSVVVVEDETAPAVPLG